MLVVSFMCHSPQPRLFLGNKNLKPYFFASSNTCCSLNVMAIALVNLNNTWEVRTFNLIFKKSII